MKRLGSACLVCEKSTEWIDLKSGYFFCYESQCFDTYLSLDQCTDADVIPSTRLIRRYIKQKCRVKDDQKCHIFGLNAAKEIFNFYARQEDCVLRIEDETIVILTKMINAKDNIYCCDATQNRRDIVTEKLFLDVFLYHRATPETLDEASIEMYDAMKRVFANVLKECKSSVLSRILADFEKIYPNK